MSDRQKYRGKRVDNGDTIKGSLVKIDGKLYIYDGVEGFCCHDFSGHERQFIFGDNFIEVQPDTVGQYTGRKDKNGVEIYFGCQAKHVDGMGSRIGTVIFDEKMCCMGIKFEETTVFGGAVLFEQCEVIHNKEQQ